MDSPVFAVFAVVYAGVIRGRLAGLATDRAGTALLGAPARVGVDLESPSWLLAAAVVLSRPASNVPAIMLSTLGGAAGWSWLWQRTAKCPKRRSVSRRPGSVGGLLDRR